MPFRFDCCYESGCFLDFAGAQAAGAHLYLACLTINYSTNLLQIGQKTTAGRIMRVADIIAGHRTFSTYFTTFSHDYTSVKRGALYVNVLHHTSKKTVAMLMYGIHLTFCR